MKRSDRHTYEKTQACGHIFLHYTRANLIQRAIRQVLSSTWPAPYQRSKITKVLWYHRCLGRPCQSYILRAPVMSLLPTRFFLNKTLVRTILFGTVFAGALMLGFWLFTTPAVISPGAGVALAGLIILGIRFWPVVFIITYVTYLALGLPFVFVTCYTIGHTLQAVFGAYVLKQFAYDTKLGRFRDTLAMTGTAFLAGAIVPTLGFIGFFISGTVEPMQFTNTLGFSWGHWWAGMILSLIVVTPFITRWIRVPHTRSIIEILETVLIFIPLIGIAVLIFWLGIGSVVGISLVYFLFVPLGWIAFRLGPRMTVTALFILAALALGGTMFGAEEMTLAERGMRLFQVEVFLIIMSLIFLTLVSVEEDRKDTTISLKRNIGDLEQVLDRLNDQDRAKNNFLAILAHELRNPLATIVSSIELLRYRRQVNADGEESMNVIERRLQSINRLLDDLLDISRISEKKIKLQKKMIDLRDALTTSLQNAESATERKDQALIANIPNEPFMVKGDRTRLEQVFTNLLNNASKFTPHGGRIEISVVRKESSVSVSITDTGAGISADHLTRIFDPFYQGKNRTQETRAGLGIGLSVARDLIKMHRGHIMAKSEGVNKGSEFIITLPLVESPAFLPKDEARQQIPYDKPPHMHTILVVDDNKMAAESLAKLLGLSGFEVTTALTGTEAIERVASKAPDGILLDIGLPDMTGFEVARTLRYERDFQGTIIALSGYGQEEDKVNAYEAGCTHHITKPARLAELLEMLG